jgi:transposase
MDNMERKKRAYTTPTIKVYPIQEDNLLQAASGNAGTIGYGGGGGNAKKWEGEWEEEETHPQPLTREGSSYPSHDAWEE